MWNIPSWQRIGTGYVYSDKYVSDEEALQQFKNHLDKKGHDYSKSEFKNIKMRVGRHKRLFVKNVVAIGLSLGFYRPLESNGLYSTHEFLYTLVRTLNRGEQSTISQFDRDSYDSFVNQVLTSLQTLPVILIMLYLIEKILNIGEM